MDVINHLQYMNMSSRVERSHRPCLNNPHIIPIIILKVKKQRGDVVEGY